VILAAVVAALWADALWGLDKWFLAFCFVCGTILFTKQDYGVVYWPRANGKNDSFDQSHPAPGGIRPFLARAEACIRRMDRAAINFTRDVREGELIVSRTHFVFDLQFAGAAKLAFFNRVFGSWSCGRPNAKNNGRLSGGKTP